MSLPRRSEKSLLSDTVENIKDALDDAQIKYRKNAKKETLVKIYLENMEDDSETEEDTEPEEEVEALTPKTKKELNSLSKDAIKDLLVDAGIISDDSKLKKTELVQLYLDSLEEPEEEEPKSSEKKSGRKSTSSEKRKSSPQAKKKSPKAVAWAGGSKDIENVLVEYVRNDDWDEYIKLKNELKDKYKLSAADTKQLKKLQKDKDDELLDPVCFTTGSTKKENMDEHNVVKFTIGSEVWTFYGIYSGGTTDKTSRILMTALPSTLGLELKKVNRNKPENIEKAIKNAYESVNKSLPKSSHPTDVSALLYGPKVSYLISLEDDQVFGEDRILPTIIVNPHNKQRIVLAPQHVWDEIEDVKDSYLEVLACDCLLELVLKRFKNKGIEADATIMMVNLE